MEKLILTLILTIIIFVLALKKQYNVVILSILLLVICTSLYKYGRREEFTNRKDIGKYSNLELEDDNVVYQGNQLPIDSPQSPQSPENNDDEMFLLANNECKPECCPSTFSCDRGCVCLTDKQKRLLNNRGIPPRTSN